MLAAGGGATDGWGGPSFAKPESLALMWEYVRYFIKAYMPFIMIVVAMFVAAGLMAIILNLFTKDKEDKDDDPVEFL